MKYPFTITSKELLADTLTPVAIYLKVRDQYPNSILLEGADFKAGDNQYSFIGLLPQASISVKNQEVVYHLPKAVREVHHINSQNSLNKLLSNFLQLFTSQSSMDKLPASGLFGYTTYDAVNYFEDIQLQKELPEKEIPKLLYHFYKIIVAINHTNNKIQLIEHCFKGESSELEALEELLNNQSISAFPFEIRNQEKSNLKDEQYLQMVNQGKTHCSKGDVFQVVLSRNYSQSFSGDEFNVYRSLRSINPSPYMFYFDFGDFKLFGSSPESQIKINEGKAYINPIAGTFKRSGNDSKDKEIAEKLSTDVKENSEHIMLVDLARNDLSKNTDEVKLNYFREIHYYSHVLHMVSEVQGTIRPNTDIFKVFGDTFPAGTLSGAPKIRAMQLINQYENQARGFYGGCIGHIGFNGKMNQAITIRSFMSKNNTLYYQAGAGIVADSEPQKELEEVNNKLAALKLAIEQAQEINSTNN